MVTRMHALEVIIRRNAEAAGRECANADNDDDMHRAEEIVAAAGWNDPESRAFKQGYARGREEG